MKKCLTRTHKRILLLIDEGFSSKEIAAKLCNSVRTIETHRYHILKKYKVRSCQEIIVKAKKKGWM